MTGGNFEVIPLSHPIEKESNTAVTLDISSALRTFRDGYAYTPDATSYPLVKFKLKVYDEYMLDGEVRRTAPIYYPSENIYYTTIFGGFSDMERFVSGATKPVSRFSRKPSTTPQLVAVGETFAYTAPYTTEKTLPTSADLTAPVSRIANVTKEGLQTLGYQTVFALPSSEAEKRQVFRFINAFGTLESVSVARVFSKSVSNSSEQYVVSRQETFNSFSRSAIRKKAGNESWIFATDALDDDWLYWYVHEFLMSEHVWMSLPRNNQPGLVWVPCTITPEENITLLDRSKADIKSITFTARLDLTGSPLLY